MASICQSPWGSARHAVNTKKNISWISCIETCYNNWLYWATDITWGIITIKTNCSTLFQSNHKAGGKKNMNPSCVQFTLQFKEINRQLLKVIFLNYYILLKFYKYSIAIFEHLWVSNNLRFKTIIRVEYSVQDNLCKRRPFGVSQTSHQLH